MRWDGVSWGTFDMGPLPTGGTVDNQYLGVGAAGYASNSLFLLVIGVDGNLSSGMARVGACGATAARPRRTTS